MSAYLSTMSSSSRAFGEKAWDWARQQSIGSLQSSEAIHVPALLRASMFFNVNVVYYMQRSETASRLDLEDRG
jgi:hypothetical protein